jgi:Putative prokaryotic signal transducing protein
VTGTKDEDMALLAKYSHLHEAELSKAMLEAEGIDASVQHGHGGIETAGTWVTLWVLNKDLEAARRALEDESRRIDLTPEEETEEEDWRRIQKVARGARYLLFVAALNLMMATINWFSYRAAIQKLMTGQGDAPAAAHVHEFRLVIFSMYGAALLYTILYFWARKAVIPALVVGAGVFVMLTLWEARIGLLTGWVFFGPLGLAVTTIFLLVVWIVAIREARAGRRGTLSKES